MAHEEIEFIDAITLSVRKCAALLRAAERCDYEEQLLMDLALKAAEEAERIIEERTENSPEVKQAREHLAEAGLQ